MRIPAFLTNLHESDVECLMKAAEDTGIKDLLIIKTNAHDQYGNPLTGYVEVLTKKIDRQYTDLWTRYEYYHAWKDSDVDVEIKNLTQSFIGKKKEN